MSDSSEMVEITIRKRPRTEAVITQRKFFKKTARGKVIKGWFSVRPHYPISDHSKYFAKDIFATM